MVNRPYGWGISNLVSGDSNRKLYANFADANFCSLQNLSRYCWRQGRIQNTYIS